MCTPSLSLPLNAPVLVRIDGKARPAQVRGRARLVGQKWIYDVLLENGDILVNVPEDRVQVRVE